MSSSDETYSRNGACCPHCGYLSRADADNWQLYSEDTDEWACGSCGADFIVSVFVSYSWTCSKKDVE